eukprot:Amastigsp_a854704_5.p5 type:complete len:106 gc:universal Amastigsp_a854704_5:489-806(+)
MAHGDHVMEDNAAVRVDLRDEIRHGAERGDDKRHPMFDGDGKVRLEAWVRLVHNEVHAEGCLAVRRALDLVQPLLVALGGSLIEGRECSDDAGAARCEHEVGRRH